MCSTPHSLSVSTGVKSLTRNLWQVWVGLLRTTGVTRHTLWGFSSSEMWPADRKTHNITGDDYLELICSSLVNIRASFSSRWFMVVLRVLCFMWHHPSNQTTRWNWLLVSDVLVICMSSAVFPCDQRSSRTPPPPPLLCTSSVLLGVCCHNLNQNHHAHLWLTVISQLHIRVFPKCLILSTAHTLGQIVCAPRMTLKPCFSDLFPGFDLDCSWPASLVSAPVNHLSFCLILPLPLPCLFFSFFSAWSSELGSFNSVDYRLLGDRVFGLLPQGFTHLELFQGLMLVRIACFLRCLLHTFCEIFSCLKLLLR